MKLTAMMIVKNEADRYLEWVIPHLREFCDEIRVIDDGSSDGTYGFLVRNDCVVQRNQESTFYQHEGRARNALLDFALAGAPTHLLAIDADEMIENGQAVRQAIETHSSASGVWNLAMTEVWGANAGGLFERVDGKWGARKAPVLFEVPTRRRAGWRIADRALACGREPMEVAKLSMRGRAPILTKIYHFGWACKNDRADRYARYVKHDGGKFHNDGHLQSIMWPDQMVSLHALPWPDSLHHLEPELIERINR